MRRRRSLHGLDCRCCTPRRCCTAPRWATAWVASASCTSARASAHLSAVPQAQSVGSSCCCHCASALWIGVIQDPTCVPCRLPNFTWVVRAAPVGPPGAPSGPHASAARHPGGWLLADTALVCCTCPPSAWGTNKAIKALQHQCSDLHICMHTRSHPLGDGQKAGTPFSAGSDRRTCAPCRCGGCPPGGRRAGPVAAADGRLRAPLHPPHAAHRLRGVGAAHPRAAQPHVRAENPLMFHRMRHAQHELDSLLWSVQPHGKLAVLLSNLRC